MAVMTVWLSRITEDSERFLAECARVSRHGQGKPSDIKKDRATIRRLIRDGHESVLEHASATFLIEGISRCCMAQLLRHRHLSANITNARPGATDAHSVPGAQDNRSEQGSSLSNLLRAGYCQRGLSGHPTGLDIVY
jgi:flavin-dependent thymidylate synthase